MTGLGIAPFVRDGFSILPSVEDRQLTLKVSGNGLAEIQAALRAYLKSVHLEVLRLKLAEVAVECEELYFMSAACVKCLASWVDSVVKLSTDERYSVKFCIHSTLQWQQRSFEALRRFAPDVVAIQN